MTVRRALAIGLWFAFVFLAPKAITGLFGIENQVAERWVLFTAFIPLASASACYLWKAINLVPKCENGVCRLRDYTCLGLASKHGMDQDGLIWKCRCGMQYLQTRNRFCRIIESGQLRKFKVRTRCFGTWKDDV